MLCGHLLACKVVKLKSCICWSHYVSFNSSTKAAHTQTHTQTHAHTEGAHRVLKWRPASPQRSRAVTALVWIKSNNKHPHRYRPLWQIFIQKDHWPMSCLSGAWRAWNWQTHISSKHWYCFALTLSGIHGTIWEKRGGLKVKIGKPVTSKVKYLTLLAVIRLHRKNGVLKVNTHTHNQGRFQ